MVKVGFNAVIGSWKIVEISTPRMVRIFFSGNFVKSSPLKRMEPLTILPDGEGMSPIMALEVTLFTHPDSPTMARDSPRFKWKLAPRTGWTVPPYVDK